MGKIKLLVLTSFLLFVCFSQSVSAQELEVVKIEGQKYYIHSVEAGHTLYAITKKYNISYDNLIKANPGVDETLTIGRKLLIPLSCIDKKELRKNNVSLDGDHITHVIKKGETLYSISKKYEISIDELLDLNPTLDPNHISINEEITIPVKEITISEIDVTTEAVASNYISHIVVKGETLYSISKLYNVDKDSILSFNNLEVISLSIGQILKIPNEVVMIDSLTILNDTILENDSVFIAQLDSTKVFKERYDIALFLPFSFDKNKKKLESFSNKGHVLDDWTYETIRFYLGFIDGLDKLKTDGFRYELTVFDTKKSTKEIDKIIKTNNLNDFDLIVGPLLSNTFNHLQKQLDSLEISKTLACPLGFKNKLLLEHPNVLKFKPSEITEVYFISNYVVDSLLHENIIVLNPGRAKDDNISKALLKNIKEISLDDSVNIKYSDFSKYTFYSFSKLISRDKQNVIILPTNNMSTVQQVVTELKKLRNHEDFVGVDIRLVGLDNWTKKSFDQIESSIKNEFKWTITSPYFVDYNNEATKEYVSKYIQKYKIDPSSLGLIGYDIGEYFSYQLFNYGINFLSFYKNQNYQFNSFYTSIMLQQMGNGNGFENKGLYILEYSDYELKKVK